MSQRNETASRKQRLLTPTTPVLIAVLVISGACFFTFQDLLSYWFTGVDIFPLILSNRLESALDIPKLFTQEFLSAYGAEDVAGSVGVRPVGQISFALDYWVWKLNPFGYHLTDLVLHTLNAVLVLLLVRQLKLRQWLPIGVISSLLFGLHPLHSRTVTVMPIRFDLLMCAFTLLALIMLLRYLQFGKTRALVAVFAFMVLALGAKATAILLFPLVILTALLMREEKSSKSVPALIIVSGVLLAAYLIHRGWVIGNLGGYPIAEVGVLDSLMEVSAGFFKLLIDPVSFLAASMPGTLGTKVLVGAFGVALVLLVCVGVPHYLFKLRIPPFLFIEERVSADLKAVVVLGMWLLGFLSLYIGIHVLSGMFQPWYIYTPAAFFCIILTTVTLNVGRLAWETVIESRKYFSTALIVVTVIPLALIVSSLAFVSSGIRERFSEWAAAGDLGRRYLEELQSAVSRVPDGATIFLLNLPQGIACSRGPCAVCCTFVFEEYSVDSWVKLAMPERDLTVLAVSTIWLGIGEPVVSNISYDAGEGLITLQNTGGHINFPWHSKSGRYVWAEMESPTDPRKMSVHIRDQRISRGEYYFFDYFEPRRIFGLGSE
jgi:hypothetical protein